MLVGLKALSLHALEYRRRLQRDLIYVYKILFRKVTVNHSKMFTVTHHVKTKGQQWKLYPTHCLICHTNIFSWTCHNFLELTKNYSWYYTVCCYFWILIKNKFREHPRGIHTYIQLKSANASLKEQSPAMHYNNNVINNGGYEFYFASCMTFIQRAK